MYRVVADTNVVVSASISDGNPHRFLLEAMLCIKRTLVTSHEIISEIREVLSRQKFRLTKNEINKALSALESASDIVEVTSKFRAVGDPDDDMLSSTPRTTGAPTTSSPATATCST